MLILLLKALINPMDVAFCCVMIQILSEDVMLIKHTSKSRLHCGDLKERT